MFVRGVLRCLHIFRVAYRFSVGLVFVLHIGSMLRVFFVFAYRVYAVRIYFVLHIGSMLRICFASGLESYAVRICFVQHIGYLLRVFFTSQIGSMLLEYVSYNIQVICCSSMFRAAYRSSAARVLFVCVARRSYSV